MKKSVILMLGLSLTSLWQMRMNVHNKIEYWATHDSITDNLMEKRNELLNPYIAPLDRNTRFPKQPEYIDIFGIRSYRDGGLTWAK